MHKVRIGRKLWISDESGSLNLNRIQSSFISSALSIHLVFAVHLLTSKKVTWKNSSDQVQPVYFFENIRLNSEFRNENKLRLRLAMTWLQPCEWNSVESWLHSWTSWFCKFLIVLLHKLIIDDCDVILIFRIEHCYLIKAVIDRLMCERSGTRDNPIISNFYPQARLSTYAFST